MTILPVLLTLASSSGIVQANEETNRARVCLIATQTENGRIINVKVEQSSGYKHVDKFALNITRVFKLDLDGQIIPRQTGYVVVDAYEDGSFAMSLIHYKGRLIKGCNDPTVLEIE